MQSSPHVTVQPHIHDAMQQVYLWMGAGLLVTAAMSRIVFNTSVLWSFILNTYVFLGLIIVEVILVIVISALVMRIQPPVAIGLYIFYAALNGITITPIAFVFTTSSIAVAFCITAGAFVGLALYGMTTKRNLTGIGQFMAMVLFGICIATITNLWLQSPLIDYVTSIVSVCVFAGLTAYDTQRLTQMAQQMHGDAQIHKFAIYGALILYLDFINLFVNIARIVGKRRN